MIPYIQCKCWVETPPIRYFQWSCFICLRLIRGGQGVNWPFVLAYPKISDKKQRRKLESEYKWILTFIISFASHNLRENSKRHRSKCDNTYVIRVSGNLWRRGEIEPFGPVINENNWTRGRCQWSTHVFLNHQYYCDQVLIGPHPLMSSPPSQVRRSDNMSCETWNPWKAKVQSYTRFVKIYTFTWLYDSIQLLKKQ